MTNSIDNVGSDYQVDQQGQKTPTGDYVLFRCTNRWLVMREARAEKDDSHDERRKQRQSGHGRGTGRAQRAGEGLPEEGRRTPRTRFSSFRRRAGCRMVLR
jgi:hypothetical protein